MEAARSCWLKVVRLNKALYKLQTIQEEIDMEEKLTL
jgi:hypothetical protein